MECGGWCPAGRLDELGRIPERYPLKELEHGSFAERTLQNVKDSDGTVIFYHHELRGGTEFTFECCQQLKRPHVLIDAGQTDPASAAARIVSFVRGHRVKILNVAGPRQSEWLEGYEYTRDALGRLVESSAT